MQTLAQQQLSVKMSSSQFNSQNHTQGTIKVVSTRVKYMSAHQHPNNITYAHTCLYMNRYICLCRFIQVYLFYLQLNRNGHSSHQTWVKRAIKLIQSYLYTSTEKLFQTAYLWQSRAVATPQRPCRITKPHQHQYMYRITA